MYDAHGDTKHLTNSTGGITWDYTYDAFGNEIELENIIPGTTANITEPYNPFRYCGEYYDQETGFIYLRARYYSPEIGRFVSEDPAFDGVNWYTYCANNPIIFVDPTGQSSNDIIYGAIQSLDQNCFGGFIEYLVGSFKDGEYSIESEYDYYLGRVIGDVLSIVYGTTESIFGVIEIIESITSGASVTIGSGGTLAVGGVAISIDGVATGSVMVSHGGATMMLASKNLGDDFEKMTNAGKTEYKKPKSGSGKEKATDVPSWAKGNAPFKSEDGKSFAKRLMDNRYGKGNWSKKSPEFSQIQKWGDRGFK